MKLEDIHPGDVLRIREWDDMEAEFGTDDEGDIACEFYFTREMEKFCGTVLTVEKIDDTRVMPDDWEAFGYCSYSADMLEPAYILESEDLSCLECFPIF